VLVAFAFWRESRSAEASTRRAVLWSIAWFALGLLSTLWFGLFDSPHAASAYAAVYLIERAHRTLGRKGGGRTESRRRHAAAAPCR
jgi:hypothetical protein